MRAEHVIFVSTGKGRILFGSLQEFSFTVNLICNSHRKKEKEKYHYRSIQCGWLSK